MKANLTELEERAVMEFRKLLRTALPDMEAAIKGTAKNASCSLTVKIGERKDGDFDVCFNGGCRLPWNGDSSKARIEGGQLVLL